MRQAFTEDNFRKIYDYENRKGVNLDGMFFPELQHEVDALKKIFASFRHLKSQRGTLPPAQYKQDRDTLNQEKIKVRERKEKKLSLALSKISDEILRGSFKLTLHKLPLPTGKIAFGPDKACAVSYFAIKQVQQNIRRVYKVKQENRSQIISQLVTLLSDPLPKWVLRLDVKSFFESIPHKILLEKLNKDAVLSYTSQRVIQRVLSEYRKASQSSIGIPRGIGVSAYLSELYMRDFDRAIGRLDDVIYYARYVDDIVVIFTPNSSKTIDDALAIIEAKLQRVQLSLNMTKVSKHDISTPKNENFEYLGYNIYFGKDPVKIKMSSKKVNRYKERVRLAVEEYNKQYAFDYNRASKLLYRRLKFITGNTRLYDNKKHILTGIYFSNKYLNDYIDLTDLDTYLKYQVHLNSRISSTFKAKMQTLSFKEGFTEKVFYLFPKKELAKIPEAWKNVT